MGLVRIHCWGCPESVSVEDGSGADGLARVGWTVSHGETYCPACVEARGLEALPAPAEVPDGAPAVLERFPNPVSSEGRFARSMRLLRESAQLLAERPQLAVFPVVSFVLSIVVGVVCFGVWAPIHHAASANARDALLVPSLIAAYPLTFVSVYCSVALAAVLQLHIDGDSPTAASGFKAANERLGVIAGWSLLVCTVGLLLRLLEERLPLAGRIAASIFGLGWSLATLFAIPVLAYERRGPFATVRRSTQIFKVRWGSSILGGAGIGFAGSLLTLPFVLLLIVGLARPNGAGAALILIGAGGICATAALTAALEQVFRVFVYRSAVGLDTSAGPFAPSDLRQPLSRRGRG